MPGDEEARGIAVVRPTSDPDQALGEDPPSRGVLTTSSGAPGAGPFDAGARPDEAQPPSATDTGSAERAPWPMFPLVRAPLYIAILLSCLLTLVHAATTAAAGARPGAEFTLVSLRQLLDEDGWLEYAQVAMLTLSAAFMLARSPAGRHALHGVFGYLLLFATFRELDRAMDHLVFERSNRVVMAVFAALVLRAAWQERSRLRDEVVAFLGRPSFGLMLAGFVLVLVMGQVLGQRDFWKVVSLHVYKSAPKRLIEEGLEASGYLLILFGVVEERFFLRRGREAADAST